MTSPSLSARTAALLRWVWLVLAGVVAVCIVLAVRLNLILIHTPCTGKGCGTPFRLDAQQMAGLVHAGISVSAYGVYINLVQVVTMTTFATVAAIAIWRRPRDPVAVIAAFALLLFGGFAYGGEPDTLAAAYPAWRIPIHLLALMGTMAMMVFVCTFPQGRFLPRWTALPAVIWLLLQAPRYLLPGSPLDYRQHPEVLFTLVSAGVLGFVVYVQIYRYRRLSTAVDRQRTKWVVFALGTFIALFIGLVTLVTVTSPSLGNNDAISGIVVGTGFTVAPVVIPLAIGAAIFRYRLWDIDILINRTLVYGSLTALLALVYVGSVIGLQALFHAVSGQGSGIAVALSTLVIAALFSPLRRWIQRFIDRRFYRHKYDAARTLAAFSATLRNEVDLDQLTSDLLKTVDETMRPAHASLWLRPSGATRTGAGHGA